MGVLSRPLPASAAVMAATILLPVGCASAAPIGATGNRVASHFTGEPLRVVTSEAVPTPRAVAAQSYVLQKGDTLWSLSRRFGPTVAELTAANGIADASSVRAGMRLSIPHASGGTDAKPDAKPSTSAGTNTAKAVPSRPASKPAHVAARYAMRWPVKGQVTSRFGKRWGRNHDGIDIGAPEGTAVEAAAAGEVLFSATHGSYGNLVVLKHPGDLVTVYAHNDVNLVRKGQRVRAGQMIGKVGHTGRATGPHLHFEIRRGTAPQNPMRFLPP